MTDSASLPVVLQALAFAADKHRDQRRKDALASPYINHPIALANVLVREGGVTDPAVLAAALLHDTVEDTQTTPSELRAAFGPAIAAIVEEVTDDKSLPKAELADKICNLRDMSDHPPVKWDLARRREYFEWAKAVIDRLRGVHPGLEALFDAAYARRP